MSEGGDVTGRAGGGVVGGWLVGGGEVGLLENVDLLMSALGDMLAGKKFLGLNGGLIGLCVGVTGVEVGDIGREVILGEVGLGVTLGVVTGEFDLRVEDGEVAPGVIGVFVWDIEKLREAFRLFSASIERRSSALSSCQ